MHTPLLRNALAVIALSGLALSTQAQMEHHHHDDAAPISTEKLGKVSFPVSCAPTSKAPMERGIALLHSFGYVEAQQQFEALTKADPGCAMAHWGVAMTQFQELWGRPDASALKLGAEEMAKARSISDQTNPTSREKLYIFALGSFFDPADIPFEKRVDAYEVKMNLLHKAFPDDMEGAAFDALAILASTAPTDTSLKHQRAALAILLPLFKANPHHPGLAHYIVHTCDTPALAPQGLAAARVYADIAPSSAHALHMPGHIFSRLGMWNEDIKSNLASVAASEKSVAAHEPGGAHQMHADEFLIYAWLQTGEDEKARALTAKMRSVGDAMAAMPYMDDMKSGGHFFDNELTAIYAIEMHDWKTAAALQPAPGSEDTDTFVTHWAHGVAAGHLHDAAMAAKAIADLDVDLEAIKKSPYAYMAELLIVQRNEILGWKNFAEDKPAEAVTAMRAAADEQDKLGQAEVDIPAREMLGDLLMMENKPKEALAEYRVALKLSPHRLNGLLSAGAAAEAAGLKSDAMSFYKEAAQQTHNAATSKRPELLREVKLVQTASK